MKRKAQHYAQVHVRKTQQANGLIRVEVFKDYWKEDVAIAQFYVPMQKGQIMLVPDEVLRYRCKHDFGITFGHYSATLGMEK